jgi:uncharacterized protein (DUF2141 family)
MAAISAAASPGLPAQSAELAVTVTGIRANNGQIGCSLYTPADEFLKPSATVARQWQKARMGGVECRFPGLKAGSYAVAVLQDFNGNRTVDTNLLGIPVEPWGVSNNARPVMRAPTYDEAAIAVGEEDSVRISVEVAEW